MSQPRAYSRAMIFPLVLIMIVGVVLYGLAQRRQQAAGFCSETGVRLPDAQVLQKAESTALSFGAVRSASVDGPVRFEIVPETELRSEEQVPAWVKQTGGFRAYVGVVGQHGPLLDQSGRRYLVVVSNCGELRHAVYEYFGGWLW